MGEDRRDAINAITSMIERSEKVWGKFAEGTAQHTLQKNRIKALQIALFLLKQEDEKTEPPFTKEELEKTKAPLLSLISKSEKAQTKLKEDSWQYKMLEENITALHMAMPLLEEEIIKSNS